jgi:hypothetical protein
MTERSFTLLFTARSRNVRDFRQNFSIAAKCPSPPPIDDRIYANEIFDRLMEDEEGDPHYKCVVNWEEGYNAVGLHSRITDAGRERVINHTSLRSSQIGLGEWLVGKVLDHVHFFDLPPFICDSSRFCRRNNGSLER